MSEAFNYHDKYLYTCFLIIAICLFLLFLSVYLVKKVFQLIGLKDLPLMLSIISVSLALICSAIGLSLNVVRIFS